MGIFNAASARDVEALRARIGRLEALVELLARHQGISEHQISQIIVPAASTASAPHATGAPISARVRQLAIEGKKIQAIKVHREETGLGLKEAKDAVEAL
ncbi:ribosomal protein L7/L12 [Nocardioides jensenii]|uniref:ribosomal protein L7/L12 n=1 Tax=Nocardioides jensenii TaxID=1843 RepID=UPI00082A4031|nr:ribosomal protein L7/L12 [Nocardioides jensenii]